MSQPPWHLWGNTQTMTVPGFTVPGGSPGFTLEPVTQGQLCRVPYLRPETFHFLFAAEIANAPDVGVDVTFELTVDFDLTVGIGRSSIIMNAFEELSWVWTNSPAPRGPNFQLRTTSVKGSRTLTPSTLVSTDITEITGDALNLAGRLTVGVVIAAPQPDIVVPDVNVIVSAQFAPKTHIRPEWFERIGRFKGHEDQAL